jgi:hypothetical protein
VIVEAHTVGQDDWTTLPDKNGHTGAPCDIDWHTIHPFLSHYQTNPTSAADCTNAGTRGGKWNGATGNSGGFHDCRAAEGLSTGCAARLGRVEPLGVHWYRFTNGDHD